MATTESEGIMGYAQIHTPEGWVDVEDIPMIETVNCQLCNEPTQASDITITARIVEGVVVAGTWSCNKCKAVNG
mgnify:CR=1 FL=1|jgi:hypothetical protein